MREPLAATPVIRTAVPADLSLLQQVFRAASLANAGDAPHLLAHPEFLVFPGDGIADGRTRLAESGPAPDGTVLGFSTVAPGLNRELELDDLFVDPRFQRRGVARALIADVMASARAGGYRQVSVIANPHASAFYTAVGFRGDRLVTTALGDGLRLHRDVA
ncbi:MAG: GNAT family N-acetyltransferase [Cellulomonas sp.]